MKITFLENSGFMVVTDKAVIIFDYRSEEHTSELQSQR